MLFYCFSQARPSWALLVVVTLGIASGCDSSPAPKDGAGAPSDSDSASETEPSCTQVLWWTDADGDGYGAGPEVLSCTPPDASSVERTGDCDDNDVNVSPDGFEGDATTCHDGLDNDCSGTVDCEDAACADACIEDCTNDFDDDLDGAVDCADDDCDRAPECQEDCTNGLDDDLDGAIDCSDPDCASDPACPEDCINGIDDDADGLVDCEDAECSAAPECQEDCSNGIDDDLDGSADCDDDDCWGVPECLSFRSSVQSGHLRYATRQASSVPFSTSRQLVVDSASGVVSTYQLGSGWQQCGWSVQPWSTAFLVSSTGGEIFAPSRGRVTFTGSCSASSAALPAQFLVNGGAGLPVYGYSSFQLGRWYTGATTATWTTGSVDTAFWRSVQLAPSDPWTVY